MNKYLSFTAEIDHRLTDLLTDGLFRGNNMYCKIAIVDSSLVQGI